MSKSNQKRLLLIQLNEINFDLVSEYLVKSSSKLKNLKRLYQFKQVQTTAETEYDKLEPWIQWVSVYTGMSFAEHKVFRLGDVEHRNVRQIFEILEENGYQVGAVCPMNAKNNLKAPNFFFPDPWTSTKTDGGYWSNILTKSISQAVNDNSNAKISLQSLCFLLFGLIRFSKIKNYFLYLKLALGSWKAPWRKALFLDLFLADLFYSKVTTFAPNFSSLFLNAGAHIQHHYMWSAQPIKANLESQNPKWYIPDSIDPIHEMLEVYDRLIGLLLKIKGYEFIFSTGLSQKPYDRLKFYYRLENHADFLKKMGINFKTVRPRMTRDFLIDFDNQEELHYAKKQLSSLVFNDDDEKLFGEIEERANSLFVTLSYPNEIKKGMIVSNNKLQFEVIDEVSFVAIKNGMHDTKGYIFLTEGIQAAIPNENSHVKNIFNTIMHFFNAKLNNQ